MIKVDEFLLAIFETNFGSRFHVTSQIQNFKNQRCAFLQAQGQPVCHQFDGVGTMGSAAAAAINNKLQRCVVAAVARVRS